MASTRETYPSVLSMDQHSYASFTFHRRRPTFVIRTVRYRRLPRLCDQSRTRRFFSDWRYQTVMMREELLWLLTEDDVLILESCSYHEVFKSLSSFGFLWQDKEFRLAKLKAHYIYDRYISTPDALDQTNIPADAAFSIYNRLYSPKIVSPLLYFNLFNDVEKFLLEKWLRFFLQ